MAHSTLDPDHLDYSRGTMEIREQKATFHMFMGLVKWGSLVTAALLLFLSVWFGTEAGFFTAFVTAGVVFVLGWMLLRDRRRDEAGH